MAYIGLGANLGEREAMLREAVVRLAALGAVRAVSSLYETEPVGYADQPAFLNAAVALETALSPDEIVRRLLAIEHDLGRVRTFRNAPRTLDLDLLLLDGLVSAAPGATVPHPRMHERAFVLVPLAEIAPSVIHPTLHRSIAELANALPDRSGVRPFVRPGWERGSLE
ncbi:MAG: 2-amino-4-hydroxy-6-hydroxymethyldihydropteridine diphosphokinase [Thermomicrobiales bacterium]|nr:2-amino-4-hydroxy-6-hydroxymethyldihydropteridine diphosphokinase [Thermomicrobiales bacterium]